MSWKDDYIVKYGEKVYTERLRRARKWHKENSKKVKIRHRKSRTINSKKANSKLKKWREANPQKVKEYNQELCRKGGKRYEAALKYNRTGLPGERNRIRAKHRGLWSIYKKTIAPNSQIHHCWIANTAEYRGVALVEANQHMHGFINVIEILEGEITLFAEEEIRNR